MYEHHIAVSVPGATTHRPCPHLPERVRAILIATAEDHGVTVEDILGARRYAEIAHARFDAAWRLRRMSWRGGAQCVGRPSLPQIGRWLGRDHTTVGDMLRRAEGMWG